MGNKIKKQQLNHSKMNMLKLAVALIATTATVYAKKEEEQEPDYEPILDEDLDVFENDVPTLKCRDIATGPHDWCWLRSNKYKEQDRYTKLGDIRDKINASLLEKPVDFKWTEVDNFFTQRAQGSFCQRADEAKGSRIKSSHTQGLTAEAEWVPVNNGNNYTGIYGSGTDTLLLRISQASNLYDNSNGLTPSMALKFLIDGEESENILVQQSFLPSGSWNFFDADLTNRLPAFDTTTEAGYIMDQTFRKKITEATNRPFALAIGHIGNIQNDGEAVPRHDVRVPY